MSFLKRILAIVSLFLASLAFSPAVQADTCPTTTMSDKLSKALRGLHYRVRNGKDMVRIKEDVNRLRAGANCYDRKILWTVLLEADAFSRTPGIALPALDVLYRNTPPDNPHYNLLLRALGKNFAIEGRTDDLQALIRNHPRAPGHIKEDWLTGLALSYAQHGDLDQAVSVADAFMQTSSPSANLYQVAIAIYEAAEHQAKLAQMTIQADIRYGELPWPDPLPGLEGGRLNLLYQYRFDPVLSDDTPLSPPNPTYPSRALQRGKEGRCDVDFDVSRTGKPINIEADCTSKLFTRTAERAIGDVRFAPLIYDGQPYARRNMSYPLEFRLSQSR